MIEVVGSEAKFIKNKTNSVIIVSSSEDCVYIQQDNDVVYLDKTSLDDFINAIRSTSDAM